MARNFLHREAQLGDDLLKRYALVVLKPLKGRLYVSLLFFGNRLVVDLGGGQCKVEGVNQNFQDGDDGGKFVRGQTFDHPVRLLLLLLNDVGIHLIHFLPALVW
jgi:hypothetical protein